MSVTTNQTDSFLKIKFSGFVHPGDVDKAFINFYRTRAKTENLQYYSIDLSSVEFVDVPAMSNIIAQAHVLGNEVNNTFFTLPKRDNVTNSLVTWGFDEAIEEVMDVDSFDSLLDKHDSDRYYRIKDIKKKNYNIESYEHLQYENFFPFRTLKREYFEKKKPEVTQDFFNKWNNDTIIAILAKHLDPENHSEDVNSIASTFPSRIVYEAITNALRHPKCDIIQTSSKFYDSKSDFSIIFWDNGESIITTLKRYINKYKDQNSFREAFFKGLQLSDFSNTDFSFNLDYKSLSIKTNMEFKPEKIWQNYKLLFSDPIKSRRILNFEFLEDFEYLLLLAVFLPGVTSDPQGKIELGIREIDTSIVGIGLSILLITVCESFKGRISVRVNGYSLKIKPSTDSSPNHPKFEASIKKFPSGLDHFKGNLFSIKIPLKEK